MTKVYYLLSGLFYFYGMKQVVCALIVHQGQLLITQHGQHSGHPWQWEFPGGKIHEGETAVDALIREISEELQIVISVEKQLEPVEFRYPGKDIRLIPFLCRWISGDIFLHVHYSYRWISPRTIFSHDMLPADFLMLHSGDNFSELLDYAGEQAQYS